MQILTKVRLENGIFVFHKYENLFCFARFFIKMPRPVEIIRDKQQSLLYM